MLHWLAETIIAIVSYVPAMFVPRDSQHFMLIRTMFALLCIVLIISIIAFQPLRKIWRRICRRGSPDSRPGP